MKEKEVIINAWNDGAYGGGQFTTTHDTSEQYFDETFNTKEKWNWKLEEKNTMYTDSSTSFQPSKSHTTNTYTDITP